MKLDETFNYIVSGIERSGTSMMMQILHAGGIQIAFDNSRKPDENNPQGYYELEGGKIINKLMDGSFPLKMYTGQFIKITAFGLRYLPKGKYKVIYMQRNIDEVLDSMEKMIKISDATRETTKKSFMKLNENVKQLLENRKDVDVLFINYNDVLHDPENNVTKCCEFIGLSNVNKKKMIEVIDKRLYRQRREH